MTEKSLKISRIVIIRTLFLKYIIIDDKRDIHLYLKLEIGCV